jgi:natural product precursor
MKTKKMRKLGLGKETIADLNSDEMRLIYGGDTLDQSEGIPTQRVASSPCFVAGDPVYLPSAPSHCESQC